MINAEQRCQTLSKTRESKSNYAVKCCQKHAVKSSDEQRCQKHAKVRTAQNKAGLNSLKAKVGNRSFLATFDTFASMS